MPASAAPVKADFRGNAAFDPAPLSLRALNHITFFQRRTLRSESPLRGAGAGWGGGRGIPGRRSAPCPGWRADVQPTEDGIPAWGRASPAGAAAAAFSGSWRHSRLWKIDVVLRNFGANRRNKTKTSVPFSPVPTAAGKPLGPLAAKRSPDPRLLGGVRVNVGSGPPCKKTEEDRGGGGGGGRSGVAARPRGVVAEAGAVPSEISIPSVADTVLAASSSRVGRAAGPAVQGREDDEAGWAQSGRPRRASAAPRTASLRLHSLPARPGCTTALG